MNVLKWAWSDVGEIHISIPGKNKFMFVFKEKKGAIKIFKDSPWTINGTWLVLKEWGFQQIVEEVEVDIVICWIQIHGLTLEMMAERNGQILGGKIGKVLEVESVGNCGGF